MCVQAHDGCSPCYRVVFGVDRLDGADEGGVGGVCGHGCSCGCWWRRGQARCQAVRLRLVVGVSALMLGPAGWW